jgi:hypothetical protein
MRPRLCGARQLFVHAMKIMVALFKSVPESVGVVFAIASLACPDFRASNCAVGIRLFNRLPEQDVEIASVTAQAF